MAGREGLNDGLCPAGHAVDGGEGATHHIEDVDEEEGEGHGLHLCAGIGGQEQSETQHGKQVINQGDVYYPKISHGDDAIEYPPHQHAEGKDDDTQHEEGHHFAGDEYIFLYGGDIDLFDGAALFFLYDIKGCLHGRHGCYEGDEDGGYDVQMEVHEGVVPIG